ncbi:unnamed protein product [Dibothriocephalus latus]|uniref:Uncharacterized protein n=1 Tax=Dibothriocephalus latus TaxID=60516 RepID=A0A3P7P6R1_DIBLA|nr:unnamed protein product [Dibothriocephalus latus]
MVDSYDYLLKFLIIGNAGTGKTCILRRFLDDVFKEDTLHTIGVEFGTKIIQIVYDISSRESFKRVSDWIASARELAKPELAIILIGNKADLPADVREEAFYEGARTALERAKASNTTDMFLPAGSSGTTYLHSRNKSTNSISSCTGSC